MFVLFCDFNFYSKVQQPWKNKSHEKKARFFFQRTINLIFILFRFLMMIFFSSSSSKLKYSVNSALFLWFFSFFFFSRKYGNDKIKLFKRCAEFWISFQLITVITSLLFFFVCPKYKFNNSVRMKIMQMST